MCVTKGRGCSAGQQGRAGSNSVLISLKDQPKAFLVVSNPCAGGGGFFNKQMC